MFLRLKVKPHNLNLHNDSQRDWKDDYGNYNIVVQTKNDFFKNVPSIPQYSNISTVLVKLFCTELSLLYGSHIHTSKHNNQVVIQSIRLLVN